MPKHRITDKYDLVTLVNSRSTFPTAAGGVPASALQFIIFQNGTITNPPPYYVRWNPYTPFLGPRFKFKNIMLVVIRDKQSRYNGMANLQTWVKLQGVVCQWTGVNENQFAKWVDEISDFKLTWW